MYACILISRLVFLFFFFRHAFSSPLSLPVHSLLLALFSSPFWFRFGSEGATFVILTRCKPARRQRRPRKAGRFRSIAKTRRPRYLVRRLHQRQRYTLLDGTRGDQADGAWASGRYLVGWMYGSGNGNWQTALVAVPNAGKTT